MIQASIERRSLRNRVSSWNGFAHLVRANDSFLALLLGAWLATFSIFLMDNFRAATAQLAAWNVVKFEMQTNTEGVSQMLPVLKRLADSQATYKEGQLAVPSAL